MGLVKSKTSSTCKNKKLNKNMDCNADIGVLQSQLRTNNISTNESPIHQEDDDVIFFVGQETVMRIPARKSILSKKNDVFHAMFCGPYTQARDNLRRRQGTSNSEPVPAQQIMAIADQVYEPDIDGRAFKNLISFLYGETVDLRSAATALETLHAAEKYLCEGLMKLCATYLAGQLNSENVLYVYQRICMYPQANNRENVPIDNQPSAPRLEELNDLSIGSQGNQNPQQQSRSSWCSFLLNCCLEFIDKNATVILRSEEFEELDAVTMESIIRRDGLHLTNEIEVLTAIIRWSVFECHRRQLDPIVNNQRYVLGHLVWHVRFSVMSAKELLEATSILETLSPGEFSALRNENMVSTTFGGNCNLPFVVTKPRNYVTSKVDTIQSASSTVVKGNFPNSNQKTCLTEKLFVCLACIFE